MLKERRKRSRRALGFSAAAVAVALGLLAAAATSGGGGESGPAVINAVTFTDQGVPQIRFGPNNPAYDLEASAGGAAQAAAQKGYDNLDPDETITIRIKQGQDFLNSDDTDWWRSIITKSLTDSGYTPEYL